MYAILGDTVAETNVALNRPCNQISTYTNHYGAGACGRAVDGDTSSDIADESCTHTERAAYAWWRVDLGQRHIIDRVTVYNRDSLGKKNQVYIDDNVYISC